jgi:hypothetical protein
VPWETLCAYEPWSLVDSRLEAPVQCHLSVVAALLRHNLRDKNHNPHFVFDTSASATMLAADTDADGRPDLADAVKKKLSKADMLGQVEAKKVTETQWQRVRSDPT